MKVLNVLPILIVCFLFSCKGPQVIIPEETKEIFKTDIKYLSSDELEGREIGTEGEKLAANYIVKRFNKMGVRGGMVNNQYFQKVSKQIKSNPHDDAPAADDPIIEGLNVVGYINNQSEHTVIIGGHYDHLGYGEEGSLHVGEPEIHNGADDNASGIAAMFYIAEQLKQKELNNNYMFIAFTGEEKGLWGSNYFVSNYEGDLTKFNYMINMDMVGRLNEEKKLHVSGTGTSTIFDTVLDGIKSPKLSLVKSPSGFGPSDHTSFYKEGIPVLSFFTGQHEDYHKPTDDYELINYVGLGEVSSFILKMVIEIDGKGKLDYLKTKDDSPKAQAFKVTLGVIPDYLFDGKGMRIDGVREDRPASNAGILKGDIVVKMGEFDVIDMNTYMECLSKFNPDETAPVKVVRDKKEMTFDVKF